MAVSGVRSSWLTLLRNSVRCLFIASSGVMSCMVATMETISPLSRRIGLALTRVVIGARPSFG